MSLVFAAFVPHPPIVHETIGKEHADQLQETRAAYQHIRDELYVTHPDTLLVITPHGAAHPHAFEVMGNPHIEVDLSLFGDLVTHASFTTDTKLVSHIREAADKHNIPLRIDGRVRCDWASSIPLLALDGDIRSVVVIRTARLNTKAHLDMGYALKDIVLETNRRIGVLATGDLSHALTSKSPAGFHEDAQTFDNAIHDILASGHLSRLMNLDPNIIKHAATCAHEPLLMLAGILARVKTYPHVLAYEAPYGVGYVTAHFALN